MNQAQIRAALRKAKYRQLSPYQRRMKLSVEEDWRIERAGSYTLLVPYHASWRSFLVAVAGAFEQIMVFRSDQRRFVLDMLAHSDSLEEIHSELTKARMTNGAPLAIRVEVYRRAAARAKDRWIYRVVFHFYEKEFDLPGMRIQVRDRWIAALNYLENHFPEGSDKKVLRCLLKQGIGLGAKQVDLWYSDVDELRAIFREGGMSARLRVPLEPFLLHRSSIPQNRPMFSRVHDRLSAFVDPKNASSYEGRLRRLLKDVYDSMSTIKGYLDTQQSYKHLGIFERHYYGVVITSVMRRPDGPRATYQSRTAAYGCLGPHGPLPVSVNLWERLEKGFWN